MVGAYYDVFDADIVEKASNAICIDIYNKCQRQTWHPENLIAKASTHLPCPD